MLKKWGRCQSLQENEGSAVDCTRKWQRTVWSEARASELEVQAGGGRDSGPEAALSSEDTRPASWPGHTRILGEKAECACLSFIIDRHNSLVRWAGGCRCQTNRTWSQTRAPGVGPSGG